MSDREFVFDEAHVPSSQFLGSFECSREDFLVVAADAPLSPWPHYMIAPRRVRPRYVLAADFDATDCVLAANPDWWATFSSAAAGAGVNHQHVHIIAGPEALPWRAASRRVLASLSDGVLIEEFDRWPNDALVIRGAHAAVSRAVRAATSFL